jgi:acyl-CoA synthetase (AMP-forming)/AMP-acid ligase II
MGEVVALDIVIDKDAEVNDEALISYCKEYLANFKVPQFIYKVQEIVMTGSGKVKRD